MHIHILYVRMCPMDIIYISSVAFKLLDSEKASATGSCISVLVRLLLNAVISFQLHSYKE